MSSYVRVELADAREGDEVYQAGKWSPVERVTVFGSRGDLVSIRWQGGGTHSGPIHHMGKARRLVVEVEGERYRDLADWELVLCRDCSTRATPVAIRRDELDAHNAWHDAELAR